MLKGWGVEERIVGRFGLRTVEGYSAVVGSSCFLGEGVVLKVAWGRRNVKSGAAGKTMSDWSWYLNVFCRD
jgi:hypothetical protein